MVYVFRPRRTYDEAKGKTFNDKHTTHDIDLSSSSLEQSLETDQDQKGKKIPIKIVWIKVIYHGLIHTAALLGAYRVFLSAMWQTNVFALLLCIVTAIGVTAGAHRLWSHRSYKATLPLRILLAFFFTLALQEDIYKWCRDHRLHHKYSETDADPHNAKRGFFFSHVGWLLCRKHPDVIEKGKTLDNGDLLEDPVVKFHRRYYHYLVLLCCFIIPTIVPMYFWNENFTTSLFVCVFLRLCLAYNFTFLVNSAAHKWGNKPCDVHIYPRENILVSLAAAGEGFHNYHHTFPFDYATSEFGIKYNITTAFIDVMAWLGLAYDRKRASKESIQSCRLKAGEDSFRLKKNGETKSVKNE